MAPPAGAHGSHPARRRLGTRDGAFPHASGGAGDRQAEADLHAVHHDVGLEAARVAVGEEEPLDEGVGVSIEAAVRIMMKSAGPVR